MVLGALLLNPKDNVATAVRNLDSGQSISLQSGGINTSVSLVDTIPFGHKFALKDIKPGEKIIKYGEIIGQATTRINKGEHVHVHNVEGLRGRGDRQ